MIEMIQYRFAVVAVVTITLVFHRTHSHVTNFHKKGNVDVFNLLLGLYKLNPLKGSKVYKTFSENVMTHGDKVTSNLRFDSNEKKDAIFRQKPFIKQLNEIEKLIHPRKKRPLHNSLEKPQFDIENVDTEKFNVDIVVNDRLAKEYGKKKEKLETVNESPIDDFSGLISHINSDFNDINDDDLPTTKLLPVNDSAITRALTNTKLYPMKHVRRQNNLDEIFNSIADGTVIQMDNYIQDTAVMNNNMEAANVIVL